MIIYQLNEDGSYAQKIVNDIKTGTWYRTDIDEEYLAWLAEGNEPLPADEPEQQPVGE